MSTTVRVSEGTRQRAAALGKATGQQLQQVIEAAVIAYERELFWDQLTQGFQALADDAPAWMGLQAERDAENPALRDGLEGDPAPR